MEIINNGELNGALLAVSQSIVDRSQLVKTLDAILSAAKKLLSAPHGIIYVLDETRQSLIPNIVQDKEDIVSKHHWQALIIDNLSEGDPFGYAVKTGEVVLITDLYQYNGYDCENIYQTEQQQGRQSRNLIAWPLVDDNQGTSGLLVALDYSNMKHESSLSAFCQLAAKCINQAIWLEKYSGAIHNLNKENNKLLEENSQLKALTHGQSALPIAHSDAMTSTLERIKKVLALPIDVLLLGETGTGKEVIAQYIHTMSNRRHSPCIVQNCAAIPEQLLESELFGHKKGAFTGADKDRVGLFEAANGGTLFLDEIGDMPLLLQAKLLRVLQEKKIKPIGAHSEIDIDVRVIAATHCDLNKKIVSGEFRADLYYRLNVFPVSLPPLRKRLEDILPLANQFIQKYANSLNLTGAPSLSDSVKQQLLSYSYPGNVRELKHIIERSVLLSDFKVIHDIEIEENTADLPVNLTMTHPETTNIQDQAQHSLDNPSPQLPGSKSLKASVNDYEKQIILECLKVCNWQVKRAAERLSLPISTLSHKMKKFEISA
ncbi:sigma 54-interacting transcriptional regulator [Vibrio sp. S4M6]|uniref:sigma-54-dependent Fis family transcriptional regulator n=1 Tax=Vibrio sinus TaxID=2946865 RepID=UPI00202A8781|nr:sigma 54-interacting transcriptional regulator [Vibrio sinus]MCL9783477.1 sigma 54-interacting transcriptional regulator [Vibrio sinus]